MPSPAKLAISYKPQKQLRMPPFGIACLSRVRVTVGSANSGVRWIQEKLLILICSAFTYYRNRSADFYIISCQSEIQFPVLLFKNISIFYIFLPQLIIFRFHAEIQPSFDGTLVYHLLILLHNLICVLTSSINKMFPIK